MVGSVEFDRASLRDAFFEFGMTEFKTFLIENAYDHRRKRVSILFPLLESRPSSLGLDTIPIPLAWIAIIGRVVWQIIFVARRE